MHRLPTRGSQGAPLPRSPVRMFCPLVPEAPGLSRRAPRAGVGDWGDVATINDFSGRSCALSDEVYVLGPDPTTIPVPDYEEGARVRLIGGVDDIPYPGHHFRKGFVTVCRTGATVAEFIGVRRRALKRTR